MRLKKLKFTSKNLNPNFIRIECFFANSRRYGVQTPLETYHSLVTMNRTYHKFLKLCVSEVLLQTGFPKTTESALNTATDLLQHFIEQTISSIETVDSDIIARNLYSKFGDSELLDFMKLQLENNEDMLTNLKILPKNYEWCRKETGFQSLADDKSENLVASIDEETFTLLEDFVFTKDTEPKCKCLTLNELKIKNNEFIVDLLTKNDKQYMLKFLETNKELKIPSHLRYKQIRRSRIILDKKNVIVLSNDKHKNYFETNSENDNIQYNNKVDILENLDDSFLSDKKDIYHRKKHKHVPKISEFDSSYFDEHKSVNLYEKFVLDKSSSFQQKIKGTTPEVNNKLMQQNNNITNSNCFLERNYESLVSNHDNFEHEHRQNAENIKFKEKNITSIEFTEKNQESLSNKHLKTYPEPNNFLSDNFEYKKFLSSKNVLEESLNHKSIYFFTNFHRFIDKNIFINLLLFVNPYLIEYLKKGCYSNEKYNLRNLVPIIYNILEQHFSFLQNTTAKFDLKLSVQSFLYVQSLLFSEIFVILQGNCNIETILHLLSFNTVIKNDNTICAYKNSLDHLKKLSNTENFNLEDNNEIIEQFQSDFKSFIEEKNSDIPHLLERNIYNNNSQKLISNQCSIKDKKNKRRKIEQNDNRDIYQMINKQKSSYLKQTELYENKNIKDFNLKQSIHDINNISNHEIDKSNANSPIQEGQYLNNQNFTKLEQDQLFKTQFVDEKNYDINYTYDFKKPQFDSAQKNFQQSDYFEDMNKFKADFKEQDNTCNFLSQHDLKNNQNTNEEAKNLLTNESLHDHYNNLNNLKYTDENDSQTKSFDHKTNKIKNNNLYEMSCDLDQEDIFSFETISILSEISYELNLLDRNQKLNDITNRETKLYESFYNLYQNNKSLEELNIDEDIYISILKEHENGFFEITSYTSKFQNNIFNNLYHLQLNNPGNE